VKIPITSSLCNNVYPNGITDAYGQKKKKNYIKEKFRYSDLILVAILQTPPRQPQKFRFSNSDAFKKETVHKSRRRLIIDHKFSLWRISLTKTMSSTKSLPDTTN
jgi:hypothetical protein